MSLRKFSGLQITCLFGLLLLPACLQTGYAQERPEPSAPQEPSQAAAAVTAAEDQTFPALLVSDIHFDPFHDPGKVQQLVEANVSRWNSILSAPASPNQQQAFAELQQKCHARGVDTFYALLHSALQAMRQRETGAKLVTLSGDLIAHSFSCRYSVLLPESKAKDYQAFVLKTMSYVMRELRASFPKVPIYAALGNNDSACGDYQLNTGSEFLERAGRIVAEGLPPSQRQEAVKDFAKGGYYAVTMTAPMPDTRFIVLNDLFLSPKYRDCNDKPNPGAATAEMTWLRKQLTEARSLQQSVWVMGHIPPGIDPYATIPRIKDVCADGAPEMFLSSDKLADLLIQYADIVRLGIFAHTHMDEIRLLESTGNSSHSSGGHSVAIKVVPSISPVDGNNPAFTVAQVNPTQAVLQDYEVIAASNGTGTGTTWSREYDFGQTYHEAQFSPATLQKLIARFRSDRSAKAESSQAYIRNYYVGGRSFEVGASWPLYVCALTNYTPKTFAHCACSASR